MRARALGLKRNEFLRNAVRSDKSIFDFSPSVFGSEYLVFFLTTA